MTAQSLGKAAANLLAPVFANRQGQSFLENVVRFSEWMQGIGAGAETSERAYKSVFSLISAPSPVIFDVGANRGQFLKAVLAEKQSSEFHVHAFEPSRAAFKDLSAWARSIPNVTLNNSALSSVSGSSVLFYDTPGSELSSLTPRSTVSLSQSEGVRLQTLDEYCITHKMESIHLLKLDVEGHELEVLRGAENLFHRSAIRAVLFEFGGCDIDARVFFHDLYAFFEAQGMGLGRLTPTGHIQPVLQYSEILERFRTTNYLATY